MSDSDPVPPNADLEGESDAGRHRPARVQSHRHHMHDAVDLVARSGMDVEQESTPDYVESTRELQMGFAEKLMRAFGGFMIIGLGIALLPLPGPGWVVIIFGLTLLPFAWAQRTITRIRRTIPGIPEDGRIPIHTWIIMVSVVILMAVLAYYFGSTVAGWMSDAWSSIWD